MKISKHTLFASGLCLLLSAALLTGATFAWFTDTVTNQGNVIQSGELDVRATGYRWDVDKGTWGEPNHNLGEALMTDSTWEPGQYNAVVVRVSNINSNLYAKVNLNFSITENENNLADALWYHITPIKTSRGNVESAVGVDQLQLKGQTVYNNNSAVETMSDIQNATGLEVTLDHKNAQGSEYYVYYLVEYGMFADAGNQYQNGSFGMDIQVQATQAPVEADGFGNPSYDADAPYEQITVEGGNSAQENGSRLRAALDGASENALIYVEEGTYAFTEPMVATKAVRLVGDGNVVLDFSGAAAPRDGGYNTDAALLVLSSHVTFENVTVYGRPGASSVVTVGIDNVGDGGLTDGNLTVSDNLNYDFQWAVNEFAPDYKGVYEDVNFLNCTFALKEAGQVGHGLFLESRYTVVDGCTFQNIQAQNAVVKIEEDHTKVLNSTFTDCTGKQYAEDWCGAQEKGDGNEYPGHPFRCESGWAGLTGEAYQAHLDYAASMGWNHAAEQD